MSGRTGLERVLARLASGRSALHVIAHPDDEHAGALCWMARAAGARVTVFSFTRGEGGENRVGRERGEDLGVRRALEMAAACIAYGVARIRFAGAADRGYRRRLEAVWREWDREALARALAREIRETRPAIVTSRFFGGPGDGHGHHQASGVLARDAVRLAADPVVELGLPPWRVSSTFVGQVPGGERIDVRVAASGAMLEAAERGYRQHATQDPEALLSSVVDHREAIYHRLEGPAELLFDGVGPGLAGAVTNGNEAGETREALAAIEEAARCGDLAGLAGAARVLGSPPGLAAVAADVALALRLHAGDQVPPIDGDVPISDPLPSVVATLPPVAVVGGAEPRVSLRDSSGATPALEARWGGGPARPITGSATGLPLPPGPLPAAIDLEVFDARGPIEAAIVREIPSPLGVLTARRPATIRVCPGPVALDRARRVGLVPGTRDIVDDALAALGVAARELDPDRGFAGALADLDTVLIAPRAYERHPGLGDHTAALLDVCRRGGQVVVMRQSGIFTPDDHAPYRGTLPPEAEEACDESAPVILLDPSHRFLMAPNRIGDADFIGWTGGRGAKLWSAWDRAYRPLVELADPGRPAQRGAWLVAGVGGGTWSYCALALEPQLAAAVRGGYRLLANLIGSATTRTEPSAPGGSE